MLTKRILTENIEESGSLDTDALLKVILAYKNAPDESGLSSAMVLMGRQLKDAMPVIPRKGNVFDDPNVARHVGNQRDRVGGQTGLGRVRGGANLANDHNYPVF